METDHARGVSGQSCSSELNCFCSHRDYCDDGEAVTTFNSRLQGIKCLERLLSLKSSGHSPVDPCPLNLKRLGCNMSKILRLGSHGPEVSLVQQRLNKCFTPPLGVDGKYGDKTQAAVIRFQKAVGFPKRDVDGVVGDKTRFALFQLFDVNICAAIKPKSNPPAKPAPPASKPVVVNPPIKTITGPKSTPASINQPPPTASDDELPRWFQLSGQFAGQYSGRDGFGLQAQLGFTARSRNYFPNSGKSLIYHSAHFEAMFAPVLGIPLPPSSTYTGQLSVTIQPITDWFVLWDRLHLLTPSLGFYGQIPLNSPSPSIPMIDDPATHSRLGGALGLEFFHVDIIKDRLSFGVSGQT